MFVCAIRLGIWTVRTREKYQVNKTIELAITTKGGEGEFKRHPSLQPCISVSFAENLPSLICI